MWREKKSQEYDMPRQHFLRDDLILDIARFGGYNLGQSINSEMKELLNIENDDLEYKRKKPMSYKQKMAFEESKKLVAKIANQENLPEQFLVSTNSLKSFAYKEKEIEEDLSKWRFQLFGKQLKEIFS